MSDKPTTREEIESVRRLICNRDSTCCCDACELAAIAMRESERADRAEEYRTNVTSVTLKPLDRALEEIARLRREVHVAGCGCHEFTSPSEIDDLCCFGGMDFCGKPRNEHPVVDPDCAAKREEKS